jgi:hypothetical protein
MVSDFLLVACVSRLWKIVSMACIVAGRLSAKVDDKHNMMSNPLRSMLKRVQSINPDVIHKQIISMWHHLSSTILSPSLWKERYGVYVGAHIYQRGLPRELLAGEVTSWQSDTKSGWKIMACSEQSNDYSYSGDAKQNEGQTWPYW